MNKYTIAGSGIMSLALLFAVLLFAGAGETASATTVVKSTDESVAGSNVPAQDDNELGVSLAKNTTYITDGVLFLQNSIGILGGGVVYDVVAITVPSAAIMKIGYSDDSNVQNQDGGVLDMSGQGGLVYNPASVRKSVHIHGSVTTGNTDGEIRLQWGHNTQDENVSATSTVEAGSFLRVEKVQ